MIRSYLLQPSMSFLLTLLLFFHIIILPAATQDSSSTTTSSTFTSSTSTATQPAPYIQTASFTPTELVAQTCPQILFHDLTSDDIPQAFWTDCLRISNWTTANRGAYVWDNGGAVGPQWVLIRAEGSCALVMRYRGHERDTYFSTSDNSNTSINKVAVVGNKDVSKIVYNAVVQFALRYGTDVVELWGNATCDQTRPPTPGGPQGGNDAVITWWLRNSSNLDMLNGELPPPDPLPPEPTETPGHGSAGSVTGTGEGTWSWMWPWIGAEKTASKREPRACWLI